MVERVVDNVKYMSLKELARILGKNEAALRARIKRGNLDAITRPMPSSNPKSKRFRYLIPLTAAMGELERVVRSSPTLQAPIDEDDSPNLYQLICDMLGRREQGLTANELQWQLERFHGISLSEDSLVEALGLFSEFQLDGDRYTLQHSVSYPRGKKDRADSRAATDVGATVVPADVERRLNALESKIDMLTQLLGNTIRA